MKKMKIVSLLIVLFFLFTFFSQKAVSMSQEASSHFSVAYFERALYGCSRLLTLNLSNETNEEINSYYKSLFADGNETLILLMYHSFYRDSEDFKTKYSISVKDFEDEILVLKELGFQPVSLEDVYYFVRFGKKIPHRAVLLTFDDGFKTFMYAYPILKKYNFKAVVSLMTGYVGSSWALSEEEVAMLSREGFIEFASHTHTLHNNFKKALEEKKYAEIEDDVKKSREFFESIGINSFTFTYPWGSGSNDGKVVKILSKYGFKAGLTTWKQQYIKPFSNPYSISRIEISERDKLSSKDEFKEFLVQYLK